MDWLWQICSGVGLSSAAGFNAYIPLLVVGIMVNGGAMSVRGGWDFLGNRWCIVVLMLLLLVEMVVDKIAGMDERNDWVQTLVRPAAGAVLFAAVTPGIAPGLAVVGLACAGIVHGCKIVSRRRINARMGRLGAPVVSVVEDLVAMVVTMVSVLVPAMGVVMVGVFAWLLVRMHGRFFGKGRAVRVRAIAVMP